ncbi:hypothetical protein BJ085DRAFT_40189 [Dimargaris cristalligena]|uniref:Uncharacterized protein n=1 Tax=Dimargaris cristalligena TaxID=215637 RepID=A0A4V1J510_9FUNG|nr:hypothetical protein BJ085DRAFT_40189 [Dimargaris cristalligena]|eukprot:RKP37429.1 hypothetical protein BJ085DRAFT_40189 [Dimargaris cristalligena]
MSPDISSHDLTELKKDDAGSNFNHNYQTYFENFKYLQSPMGVGDKLSRLQSEREGLRSESRKLQDALKKARHEPSGVVGLKGDPIGKDQRLLIQTVVEHFAFNPRQFIQICARLAPCFDTKWEVWRLFLFLQRHPTLPAFIQQQHLNMALQLPNASFPDFRNHFMRSGLQGFEFNHLCANAYHFAAQSMPEVDLDAELYADPLHVFQQSPMWPAHNPVEQTYYQTQNRMQLYSDPWCFRTINHRLSVLVRFCGVFLDYLTETVHLLPYSYRWNAKIRWQLFVTKPPFPVGRSPLASYARFILRTFFYWKKEQLRDYHWLVGSFVSFQTMCTMLENILSSVKTRSSYHRILQTALGPYEDFIFAKAEAMARTLIAVPDAPRPTQPIPDFVLDCYSGWMSITAQWSTFIGKAREHANDLFPADIRDTCALYRSLTAIDVNCLNRHSGPLLVMLSLRHFLDSASPDHSSDITRRLLEEPTPPRRLSPMEVPTSDPANGQKFLETVGDPIMVFILLAHPPDSGCITMAASSPGVSAGSPVPYSAHQAIPNQTLPADLLKQSRQLVRLRFTQFVNGPYQSYFPLTNVYLTHISIESSLANIRKTRASLDGILNPPPLLLRISARIARFHSPVGQWLHAKPRPDAINPVNYPMVKYRLAKLIKEGAVQPEGLTHDQISTIRLWIISYDIDFYVIHIYCRRGLFKPIYFGIFLSTIDQCRSYRHRISAASSALVFNTQKFKAFIARDLMVLSV